MSHIGPLGLETMTRLLLLLLLCVYRMTKTENVSTTPYRTIRRDAPTHRPNVDDDTRPKVKTTNPSGGGQFPWSVRLAPR